MPVDFIIIFSALLFFVTAFDRNYKLMIPIVPFKVNPNLFQLLTDNLIGDIYSVLYIKY